MEHEPHRSDTFGVARVTLEVPIEAAPERVWAALVGETAAWWHRDFYTAPADRPLRRMVIEPRPGGRMYEDWGEDAGAVWYSVISIDPTRSIHLLGHLPPAFGGPAMTMLQLTLSPSGAATVLHVSDTAFGRVGDADGGSTREGWVVLFEGLRRYVEEGVRA
jgi:uncharacterized protein YndB with AHSA1/START domain